MRAYCLIVSGLVLGLCAIAPAQASNADPVQCDWDVGMPAQMLNSPEAFESEERTIPTEQVVAFARDVAAMFQRDRTTGRTVEERLYPLVASGETLVGLGRYEEARCYFEAALLAEQDLPSTLFEEEKRSAIHHLAGVYWRLEASHALDEHAAAYLGEARKGFWSCMQQERAAVTDASVEACWIEQGQTRRAMRNARMRAIEGTLYSP